MASTTYVDNLMPVHYIMACVIGGIIGLVVGCFTMWHIYLAARGQTTIECLEKTRYLSPLRKSMQQTYQESGQGLQLSKYGQQFLGMHQKVLPGITRPEEGEDMMDESTPGSYEDVEGGRYSHDDSSNGHISGPDGGNGLLDTQMGARRLTYNDLERYRATKRYEEYLDEQDCKKLPHAFDLGWRRNLLHLFGPNPWLWPLPVATTTGDGWNWEASPRWIEARDRLGRERQDQRERERVAGWGVANQAGTPSSSRSPVRRNPSKADRILGRDPDMYADTPSTPLSETLSMQRLSPAGQALDMDDENETETGDSDGLFPPSDASAPRRQQQQQQQQPSWPATAEHRALDVVTNGAWGRTQRGAASRLLRPGHGTRTQQIPSRAQDEDAGGDHEGVD